MSKVNIISNPNSKSSKLIDRLKHISKQRKEYSQYDDEAPSFKEDKLVESFIITDNYIIHKLLIIVIICILSFIIYSFSLK